VRSSMGAIFHVSIELDVPLETLPTRFNNIACLTMHGDTLTSPAFKQHDCYLFGNEARGVPEIFVDEHNISRYSITGSGNIDSLNLASAVNMGLYELHRS
jgi:RNA methyltransferase, TrmH family